MTILIAPPITSEAELVARYDGRAPRYTSYPTAPYFAPAVGPEVHARWLRELPEDAALSIYLHVPCCERLCLYCACNTSVVRLQSLLRAYARTLMREIDCVAELIGGRPAVSHVHWIGRDGGSWSRSAAGRSCARSPRSSIGVCPRTPRRRGIRAPCSAGLSGSSTARAPPVQPRSAGRSRAALDLVRAPTVKLIGVARGRLAQR